MDTVDPSETQTIKRTQAFRSARRSRALQELLGAREVGIAAHAHRASKGDSYYDVEPDSAEIEELRKQVTTQYGEVVSMFLRSLTCLHLCTHRMRDCY